MTAARAQWIMIGGLLLAVVAYNAPWYTHATAGFTMNAFDLAEWASVHPAVRSESPAMWTTFLLRVPLLLIAVALAIVVNDAADPRWRWIGRLIAGVLLLRLVPPSDFFTSATDDPNYRQMALLAVIGGMAWGLSPALIRVAARWRRLGAGMLVLMGVGAGWLGLSRAGMLLDNFAIDVQVGPGIILLTGLSLVIMAAGVWPLVMARPLVRA